MPRVERYGEAWPKPERPDPAGEPAPDMAPYSGQPLPDWRESLVAEFLRPHMGPRVTALEVGPGVGDWTAAMLGSVERVFVADRRTRTLEVIRQRFGPRPDLREVQIVGDRLTSLPDASVHLVYSLDFFPFVESVQLDRWLGELSRVMRPGGALVVHHAATPRLLRTVAPRRAGLRGIRTRRSGFTVEGRTDQSTPNGWASSFTGSGLVTTRQTSSWGPGGAYTVDKYRDVITVARKPAPA